MATLVIPKTGAYKSRAVALRGVLGPLLRTAFGEISVVDRGKPEKPYIVWQLPEHVTVTIDRSLSADPEINVNRSDPIAQGNTMERDWKHESFKRYGDEDYDFNRIVDYAREQVTYNKRLWEEVVGNDAAMKEEIPEECKVPGVTIERNPRGGRYQIEMSISLTGLTKVETALVLGTLKRCKEALAPYEGRRCERCGKTPPEGEYLEEKWLPGNRREKICRNHEDSTR